MAIEDIIDARIAEALRDYKVDLKQLPISGIRDRLNQDGSADGDTSLLPHSVGPDALAVMPGARIKASGAQAFAAATFTSVTLPTVEHDTASMTATPNVITAPVTGLYLCTFRITIDVATAALCVSYMQRNGAVNLDAHRATGVAGTTMPVLLTSIAPFNRGDSCGIVQYCSTANSSTAPDAVNATLSMTFLSNYLTQV